MTEHVNVVLLGTGLSESMLAAALSKVGYSALQLDRSPFYGDTCASLSLVELLAWAATSPVTTHSTPAPALLELSARFSLSLAPTLLRATGGGIDVLVRSKVAAYLQFGLLSGVGLWEPAADTQGAGKIARVPGSKADVFNHATLSLVEKRRLTKLLLFAVGEEPLAGSALLADSTMTFPDFLSKAFSLGANVSRSLSYALTLCTTSEDLALPALERLRSFLRSTGRFGASPFLVGHYGGAGDLVGGFSRICAVWGGGQILGRPIFPLQLDPPSSTGTDTTSTTKPIGILLALDPDPAPPMLFTADWVVAAPSHLSTAFPNSTAPPPPPHSAHAIVILCSPVPFPPVKDAPETEPRDTPDSNLFVFDPKALCVELGTVTALQVGSGTFASPEGYHVLYLHAPILDPQASASSSAEALLQPYLDALLELSTPASVPSFACFHSVSPPATCTITLPSNVLIVPASPAEGTTASLVTSVDDAAAIAEKLFWDIVGEQGRTDGLLFFARDAVQTEEDEE